MPEGCKDCFSELLLKLMPRGQYEVMIGSSEHREAVLEMCEKVQKIPGIRKTNWMKRHTLTLHYFSSLSDWYICEWDREDDFFGYVILNGDLECSEWGYFSLKDLFRLEPVLEKRGDILNLDFHCTHETIEDALYERDNKYFAKYKKPKLTLKSLWEKVTNFKFSGGK